MNKWYGYLLTNGEIQVKRYFDRRDIEEANESDFVALVLPPFDAEHREDALDQAHEKLK